MRKPMGKKPSHLIHVGRPDVEAPHHSLERCEKFHEEHPDVTMILILWDKKDVDDLKDKVNKDKCSIFLWNDDSKLLSWLLGMLGDVVGAQVVSPRWYVCPDKHITKGTYKTLVEKCEEEGCDLDVVIQEPYKDKLKEFAVLFGKVCSLATFDTLSGEFLHQVVSPTGNVLRNMPIALGCEHKKAIQLKDLKGTGAHRPAILCAAGPSLEDALPDLKRLQRKCTIICVGRSFKLLRHHGIRVDYTLSVEMFDWDAAIFSGLTKKDVGKTVLAFASMCAPATVRAWPGKTVCLWDMATAELIGRDDHIFGGNSISHHMLNFAAQVLEAKEIVLVGMDLAYTKPRTHAEGTHHSDWPDPVKEQELAYHANTEWVPCTGKGEFHPECHRTPVVLGGGFAVSKFIEVRSSPSYKNFCTLMEVLIHRHSDEGRKIYNACPNGQKIGGTEYLDLGGYRP